MKQQISTTPIYTIGFNFMVISLAIIFLWLGIFKFTPTEASAIQPLIENHFLTSWLYDVMSLQAVSNLIGIIEIVIALLLLAGLFKRYLWYLAGIGIVSTFSVTISFLFTTPNTFRIIDNFYITDFFILKDLAFIGFGLMLMENNKNK